MAINGIVEGVRISGVACATPDCVVHNQEFVPTFGLEQVEKFEKMVGVRERHWVRGDETTSSLTVRAARKLAEGGKCSLLDVDALLFVSQTPSGRLPATACRLHGELGLKKDCMAFDINLGCSGFVYGVFVAASILKTASVNKVLLCGGDTISRIVDAKDPASAPLFGDAGFAVILEKGEAAAPIRYAFKTDGEGADAIRCAVDGKLKMDGVDVFNFTINEVPDLINSEILSAGLTSDIIDYLVLHQANKFVLKQVAMATGFSMKKVPLSIDRYGNTSSASIPLTLCDLAANNKGLGIKKILMAGFGVGLSWGTLIMDFDFSTCMSL